LATETGIIGLALFAAFLWVLYQCRSRVRTPLTTCTLGLAVYWFAAAQVSGDMVSNGMCWVTAMLWACSQFQPAGSTVTVATVPFSTIQSQAALR
jgi:hypothetical protein